MSQVQKTHFADDATLERLTRYERLLEEMAAWDCDCDFGEYGTIYGGRCPSCRAQDALRAQPEQDSES